MKHYFYSHIITIESITSSLESLSLSTEEKKQLFLLLEESLHYAIIDAVLSNLSEDDKKTFLIHLHTKSPEELWMFLQTKGDDFEEKIQKTARQLIEMLLNDIQELHKE